MGSANLRIAGDGERALSKKFKFTIESVTSAKCPAGKGRTWSYDSKSPLALMTTEKGAKRFYVYRKVDGRPQRILIGKFPDLSVEQARKLAQAKVVDIANGIDPMAEKRQARAKAMTFGELFKWFLEEHAKPNKRSWDKDESRYEFHLKPLANRRLRDVTRQDIAAVHRKVAASTSGSNANRVIALVSAIFNRARDIGWEGGNPAEGVERFREKSRDRFLTAEELPRFFAALDSEPIPDWRDFFKLCLFTGARSGNVKSARWADIDLTGGTWRIPADDAKAGETINVHLSAEALAILKDRRVAAVEKAIENHNGEGKPEVNPWVFPSRGKRGHVEEPKKVWAALLERAKIENLWIHDLRRSLGSWAAATGASLSVIGKQLGHKNQSTTAIYARLQLDAVRESVNTATAAIVAASKVKSAETT